MSLLDGALYLASLLAIFTYVAMALRRSEFGLILLTYELPFFLGCCVYPLVFAAGLITPGIEGRSALASIGLPGTLTALHVFSLASGTLVGYAVGRNRVRRFPVNAQRLAEFLVPDTLVAWRVLVLAGITVLIIFMLIVGVETALVNAALARSGVFEGFEDNLEWLFLKRLAGIFGLVFVFVPAVLMLKRERALFAIVYLAFVALLYMNSISRVLLIRMLVLPTMIYLYMTGALFRPKAVFVLPALGIFVAFIVVYGKGFGGAAGAFFGEDAGFQVSEWQTDAGVFGVVGALLRNMEAEWFSIAAGIKHFANNGPFIPPDVIAATFGFVPSRVLDWVGLGTYHYSSVDPKLACTNTALLGLEGCFVPPFTPGYSAYLAPVAAGFLFGFARTCIFGWLESIWIGFRGHSVALLWFPFLGVHLTAQLFSFIPVNISIVAFVVLALTLYGFSRLALERLPSLRNV